MTSSKVFHRHIAAPASQEADRVLQPEPVEGVHTAGELDLLFDPQALHADAASLTDPRWRHSANTAPRAQLMLGLQQRIGNQAVQRLLAQRSGQGPFEVEDETAARINRERGGGQPLGKDIQARMSQAMQADLSGVRVHTSSEADQLNRRLGALAFTTGRDIFFRAGQYDPYSTSGQELIAHELAHVVQQSSGAVGGGSRMTVNEPGDTYEQAADAVARSVMSDQSQNQRAEIGAGDVQRQEIDEEEVQLKAAPDALAQRQSIPEEEEEELQMKSDAGAWVQRQEDDAGGGEDVEEEVIPPNVPSGLTGSGEIESLDGEDPYYAEAFGKWSFKADGLTTAEFLAPNFTTSGEKAKPAKGCDGCDSKDCFSVSATATITFDVNINVDLPKGSDFTDLKECEQKQVQKAIDTILAPHERKHVAAFSKYKGTVRKAISGLACRADVESGDAFTKLAEPVATAEASKRSASARAASKKLDPFEVNVDLTECKDKDEEKQSSIEGAGEGEGEGEGGESEFAYA